ncbi:plasmid replication initiator protein [soil metagenome]
MSPLVADIDFVLARASNPGEFERWIERARSTGWCEHPIRLTGATHHVDAATGEIVASYRTDDEPNGHLLKACGTRRATVCVPCSTVYRSDAWQLIAAGLRGGKGVPSDVTTHPLLFVTLTAPSFGTVHSRRIENGQARICHVESHARCRHGRPKACDAIHEPEDPGLGEPLCLDCFDYVGAVLWNAHATELWRRTLIGMQRQLASHLGVRGSKLGDHARLSFAKVVEYQHRGLIHLHVVIRLDGPGGSTDAPPNSIGISTLEATVVKASQQVRCVYPDTLEVSGEVRWGEQIDVRRITLGSVAPEAVAAYVSKYATKSTEPLGRLDRRLRASDLERLGVRPHLEQLVRTAWRLGGRSDLEHLGLRRWAHTLGFRGHWLTKSWHYSTTLGALRAARAEWTADNHDDRQQLGEVEAVKDWRYVGRGWDNPGDEWLARTAAAAAIEARQLARRAGRAASERMQE